MFFIDTIVYIQLIIDFKSFWLVNITLIAANSTYSFKWMQSVTSRIQGPQWLSGTLLDYRLRGSRFGLTGVTSLCLKEKLIKPCLLLVQPRKTCPDITETLLTGM